MSFLSLRVFSRISCVNVIYPLLQVVEDGYEFFAKRQLVTLFSAPNYCGEFDNAGGMMSVDESLMCSFQVCFGFLSNQRLYQISSFVFCFGKTKSIHRIKHLVL